MNNKFCVLVITLLSIFTMNMIAEATITVGNISITSSPK